MDLIKDSLEITQNNDKIREEAVCLSEDIKNFVTVEALPKFLETIATEKTEDLFSIKVGNLVFDFYIEDYTPAVKIKLGDKFSTIFFNRYYSAYFLKSGIINTKADFDTLMMIHKELEKMNKEDYDKELEKFAEKIKSDQEEIIKSLKNYCKN